MKTGAILLACGMPREKFAKRKTTLTYNTGYETLFCMTSDTLTIADLAKACGVSRYTVSAILFPSPGNACIGFSEATRQRVIETSKRLNYRPHRASRNLLRKRQGVIGVLTSSIYTVPWTSIHAMLMQARQHDQVLSFEYFSPEDPELPLFIRERVVDGLIIYEAVPPVIEDAVASYRIPTVYVNTCRHQPHTINMDEAGAMKHVVRHLAAQGRKRLALIFHNGDTPYELERIAALQRACADLHLPAPQVLCFPDERRETIEQRLTGMLSDVSACDALIAPHVRFVSLIYKVCARLGRRIPQELGVVSMLNSDIFNDFDPPVSAFELPDQVWGERAVDMLNRIIAEEEPTDEILLPYQFIDR